jgi:hypothetical protein
MSNKIAVIKDKIFWLEQEVKQEQDLLDKWSAAGGKVDWNAGVQIARITRDLKKATKKLDFQKRKLNRLLEKESA